MAQNNSLSNSKKYISQLTKQLPHIKLPQSQIFTYPFSYGQQALSIQPLFQMPDNIARLYIEILVYKRRVLKVEKGVRFTTIHLSPPKKNDYATRKFFRNKMYDPVILGNIFDY